MKVFGLFIYADVYRYDKIVSVHFYILISNREVWIMNPKDRVAAGLLGIFLGALGIHKFYLGYTKEGVIMLVVSVATCGIGASVMSIIGFIEGIIYLTKSEDDFQYLYVENYKGWF